jgi:p-hydroxybenzoate 3-monooxygenase
MTMMLHRHDDDGDFAQKLQLPELKYACNSAAAATTLAENYVGLEAI